MNTPDDGDEKTPIAVALGMQQGDLPRVLASGKGFWAEQIMALAFANGVKVREDADLAQMLTALDIDAPIPVEAFGAVAEILAYVYRANNIYSGRGEGTDER
jgi:flagellar biosynthesis protein